MSISILLIKLWQQVNVVIVNFLIYWWLVVPVVIGELSKPQCRSWLNLCEAICFSRCQSFEDGNGEELYVARLERTFWGATDVSCDVALLCRCSVRKLRQCDSYYLNSHKYVCITIYQPDTKPNPNPITKHHAIVNIQLNIVACPTYPVNGTCCTVCTTLGCDGHTAKNSYPT